MLRPPFLKHVVKHSVPLFPHPYNGMLTASASQDSGSEAAMRVKC